MLASQTSQIKANLDPARAEKVDWLLKKMYAESSRAVTLATEPNKSLSLHDAQTLKKYLRELLRELSNTMVEGGATNTGILRSALDTLDRYQPALINNIEVPTTKEVYPPLAKDIMRKYPE